MHRILAFKGLKEFFVSFKLCLSFILVDLIVFILTNQHPVTFLCCNRGRMGERLQNESYICDNQLLNVVFFCIFSILKSCFCKCMSCFSLKKTVPQKTFEKPSFHFIILRSLCIYVFFRYALGSDRESGRGQNYSSTSFRMKK